MEIAVVSGFILLIVNVLVVLRISQSDAAEISKVTWVAAVLLLPVFAHIAWYLLGPGRPE
jgi:hypothetical protein